MFCFALCRPISQESNNQRSDTLHTQLLGESRGRSVVRKKSEKEKCLSKVSKSNNHRPDGTETADVKKTINWMLLEIESLIQLTPHK